VQIQRQVVLQLGAAGGEAVRDSAGEAAAKISENRRKVGVRIALVEEDGLAGLGRDFQLGDEGRALRFGRREIAEIVQAAFAGRNDLGQAQQVAQPRAGGDVEAQRMVGMYAGGARQVRGEGGRQSRRVAGTRQVCARDDLAPHAGFERACNHRVTIRCEAVVGEVRPNID
jgi:hypothetical protein